MLNKCFFQGNLVRDVELFSTSSGSEVARFTLAVSRSYVKQGEERQTDFLNFTAFGKTANRVATYLHKGTQVLVESEAQVRKYEKNGETRYSTDFIVNGFEFCGHGESGYRASDEDAKLRKSNEEKQKLEEAMALDEFMPVDSAELPF